MEMLVAPGQYGRCCFGLAASPQDEDFEVKASVASVLSPLQSRVRSGWRHSLLAGGTLRGVVPKGMCRREENHGDHMVHCNIVIYDSKLVYLNRPHPA